MLTCCTFKCFDFTVLFLMFFSGLSRWYAFSSVQLKEALQFLTSGNFSDLKEDQALEEMTEYIAGSVYASQTTTSQDEMIVKNLALTVMRDCVSSKNGKLEICDFEIDLPAQNIGSFYLKLLVSICENV